jgi:hypothetical protein
MTPHGRKVVDKALSPDRLRPIHFVLPGGASEIEHQTSGLGRNGDRSSEKVL